jgi:hypothetical protein
MPGYGEQLVLLQGTTPSVSTATGEVPPRPSGRPGEAPRSGTETTKYISYNQISQWQKTVKKQEVDKPTTKVRTGSHSGHERLILDQRHGLSPAEMVERQLQRVLVRSASPGTYTIRPPAG